MPVGSARGEGFLARVLDDPQQQILVGVRDTAVVGYAHVLVRQSPDAPYRVERRYGEIESLAVLPEAQRLGVGRRLIDAARTWLAGQGIHDHQIAVHAFNQGALRLYRQMGFAPSVILLRRTD